jgi:hypothetical protein
MSAQSRQPEGTTGVVHIVCRNSSRQNAASIFLIRFGGKKDGVGAFYLGKASGYDALAASLRRLGVSEQEMDSALQVLMAQPHHEIPNVTGTTEFLRALGS